MAIPLPIFNVVSTRTGLRIRAATLRLCALANSISMPSATRHRIFDFKSQGKKESLHKDLGDKELTRIWAVKNADVQTTASNLKDNP